VQPASGQVDATVSRSVQQVVSEKASNVLQDFRRARGVQSVATKVGTEAGAIETSCVTTWLGSSLMNGYPESAACQLKCRPKASRAGAEYYYQRARGHVEKQG
jgi:hypothetical protein